MDPVLRTLLLERLSASELAAEAKQVIELACAEGPEAAGGGAPPVWLSSVTVEGFRGIGAPATLPLEPAPGLTVLESLADVGLRDLRDAVAARGLGIPAA